MRGLTCVYSSDPKRVKPEDSSDEGEICTTPSHDHLSGALRNSGAIRARRNTEYVIFFHFYQMYGKAFSSDFDSFPAAAHSFQEELHG